MYVQMIATFLANQCELLSFFLTVTEFLHSYPSGIQLVAVFQGTYFSFLRSFVVLFIISFLPLMETAYCIFLFLKLSLLRS